MATGGLYYVGNDDAWGDAHSLTFVAVTPEQAEVISELDSEDVPDYLRSLAI